MPIEFNCSQCDSHLRIADEHAGKKGRCPTCQSLFDIPSNQDFKVGSPFPTGSDAERTQEYYQPASKPDFPNENNPYATPTSTGHAGMRGRKAPHRGTQIFVFSILGLFCCFPFGIIAWVMANEDLAKMRRGTMDASGKSFTQAGRVIGIVTVALNGISIIYNLLTFVFA
ncbi:MAG: DUF4190 domain-containing protein [Mariniblastus sp.]|nr:DUF4190 domain-containing protein [Mariniblastus sp.]